MDTRRRQLGWPWWRVCVATDLSMNTIKQMRRGMASERTRASAAAWLDGRHTAPPRHSQAFE
ncbi:hypothetical protein [Sphaerisporangium sp. NPDC051011]|uniref:hypothetical protein n=1 Tax=Sphaerisporangium sp. NPDC051011 TaxID=3155792 RepID=UPI0033C07CAD